MSFGIFESALTSESEVGLARQAAVDKKQAAIYDVREKLGPSLFASRDLQEFRDRVAMMKNDQSIYKIIGAHIHPSTGVVRSIVGKNSVLEKEFKAKLADIGDALGMPNTNIGPNGTPNRSSNPWAAMGQAEGMGPPTPPRTSEPNGLPGDDIGPRDGSIPGPIGATASVSPNDPFAGAMAKGSVPGAAPPPVDDPQQDGRGYVNNMDTFASVRRQAELPPPPALGGGQDYTSSPQVRSPAAGADPTHENLTPGEEQSVLMASVRRADFNGDLDTDSTFSPSSGELKPQGDFKAYQNKMDQGARSKVERNFTKAGPTEEHTDDPAKHNFASRQAMTLYSDWCEANNVNPARMASLDAYAQNLSDDQYFRLANTLTASSYTDDKLGPGMGWPDHNPVTTYQSVPQSSDWPSYSPSTPKGQGKRKLRDVTAAGGAYDDPRVQRAIHEHLQGQEDNPFKNNPEFDKMVNGIIENSPGLNPNHPQHQRDRELAQAWGRDDRWHGDPDPREARRDPLLSYVAWCDRYDYHPTHTGLFRYYAANKPLTAREYAYCAHRIAHALRVADSGYLRDLKKNPVTPDSEDEFWRGKIDAEYDHVHPAAWSTTNEGRAGKSREDWIKSQGEHYNRGYYHHGRRRTAAPDYLQKADDALTQLLNQKAQEFQETIAPLQQALVTVQQAEQLQQQSNPLNVLPPPGTVNVMPGSQDAGPAGMPAPGAQDLGAAAQALAGGGAPGAAGLGAAPGGGTPDDQGGPPPAAAQGGLPPDQAQQMMARRKRGGSGKDRGASSPRTGASVFDLWDKWQQNRGSSGNLPMGGDPDYDNFAQEMGVGQKAIQKLKQHHQSGGVTVGSRRHARFVYKSEIPGVPAHNQREQPQEFWDAYSQHREDGYHPPAAYARAFAQHGVAAQPGGVTVGSRHRGYTTGPGGPSVPVPPAPTQPPGDWEGMGTIPPNGPSVMPPAQQRGGVRKGAPFAGYEDFDDCTAKNSDKDRPDAYCGEIKHRTEDKKASRRRADTNFEPIPGWPHPDGTEEMNPGDGVNQVQVPMGFHVMARRRYLAWCRRNNLKAASAKNFYWYAAKVHPREAALLTGAEHDYDPTNEEQIFAPARGHGWEHASGPSGVPYTRPQSGPGRHEGSRKQADLVDLITHREHFGPRRKVSGWDWDNHLNGYLANRPGHFSCECGSSFPTPSGFHRCACGRQWNSYVIGTGGPSREASTEKFIVREVPVRPDVIVANRRLSGDYDPEWANVLHERQRRQEHAPQESEVRPRRDPAYVRLPEAAKGYSYDEADPYSGAAYYDDPDPEPFTDPRDRNPNKKRRAGLNGPDSYGYYWDDEGNEHDPESPEVAEHKKRPKDKAKAAALSDSYVYPGAEGAEKSRRRQEIIEPILDEMAQRGWNPRPRPIEDVKEYRMGTRHRLIDPGELDDGEDDDLPTFKKPPADWARRGDGARWQGSPIGASR